VITLTNVSGNPNLFVNFILSPLVEQRTYCIRSAYLIGVALWCQQVLQLIS